MDNTALANKKNRVGKSQLETELNRINREQFIEIRMHNNAKQRFKNKYAKLDVFDNAKGSEASDVVMFETHNPGFCYRRNGDCRMQQNSVKGSSVDMEDLHMLLFTDGDVDIDKVVCLYLLIGHKTESLTPPPKSFRTSFLSRAQSPLERLVERSKKKFDNKLLKMLPLYIIETNQGPKKEYIRDARLLSKIMINDKILQIITSVKAALEVSNPGTVQHFLDVAHNKEAIVRIMETPKMKLFFKSLCGQNVISSCESFHLELPKNVISFHIGVEPLEDLVCTIRKNALQMPTSDRWNLFYTNTSDSVESKDDKSSRVEDPSKPSTSKSLETIGSFESSEASTMGKVNSHRHSKILRNLQMGFSSRKYEKEITNPSNISIDKMNLSDLANLLNQKVRKEVRKEYDKLNETQNESSSSSYISTSSGSPPSKITLKMTRCEACMNKWKTPLPSPKMSKIRKIPLPVLKDTTYYSSRSAQRISDIIDDQVKKFERYGSTAKAERADISNRIYQEMAKGNYLDDASIEIVNLADLELAKIRQEIKENETKKKLDKFLSR